MNAPDSIMTKLLASRVNLVNYIKAAAAAAAAQSQSEVGEGAWAGMGASAAFVAALALAALAKAEVAGAEGPGTEAMVAVERSQMMSRGWFHLPRPKWRCLSERRWSHWLTRTGSAVRASHGCSWRSLLVRRRAPSMSLVP